MEAATEATIIAAHGMEHVGHTILSTLNEREPGICSLQVIAGRTAPNGEHLPQIPDNARGTSVFYIPNPNGIPGEVCWNMMLELNAIYHADPNEITVVAPWLYGLRQDRKEKPRVSINAQVLLRAIENDPGVRRLMTLEMHSMTLQAAFYKPMDHIPGETIFADYIRREFDGRIDQLAGMAPDLSSASRVRNLLRRVYSEADLPIAIVEKNRDTATGETQILSMQKVDMRGRIMVSFDDIIDTAGTACKAINAARVLEPSDIYLFGVHAPLSNSDGVSAYSRLESTGAKVVVTDSLRTELRSWLTVVPTAPYFAEAIYANLRRGSVSKIINNGVRAS